MIIFSGRGDSSGASRQGKAGSVVERAPPAVSAAVLSLLPPPESPLVQQKLKLLGDLKAASGRCRGFEDNNDKKRPCVRNKSVPWMGRKKRARGMCEAS